MAVEKVLFAGGKSLVVFAAFVMDGCLTNVILFDAIMTVLLDFGVGGAWHSYAAHATHVRTPPDFEHVDQFHLFAFD